jgi:hypothetical protein
MNLKEYEKRYVKANFEYLHERVIFDSYKMAEKIRDDRKLGKKMGDKIVKTIGKVIKGVEMTPELLYNIYKEITVKGLFKKVEFKENNGDMVIEMETFDYDTKLVGKTGNKIVRWNITRSLNGFLKDLMKELNGADYSLIISDPEVSL